MRHTSLHGTSEVYKIGTVETRLHGASISLLAALIMAIMASNENQMSQSEAQSLLFESITMNDSNGVAQTVTVLDLLQEAASSNVTATTQSLQKYINSLDQMHLFEALKWLTFGLTLVAGMASVIFTMGAGAAVATMLITGLLASPLTSDVILPALTNAIAHSIAAQEGGFYDDQGIQERARIIAQVIMAVLTVVVSAGLSGFSSAGQVAQITGNATRNAANGTDVFASRLYNAVAARFTSSGLGFKIVGDSIGAVMQSGLLTLAIQKLAERVAGDDMTMKIVIMMMTLLAVGVAASYGSLAASSKYFGSIKNLGTEHANIQLIAKMFGGVLDDFPISKIFRLSQVLYGLGSVAGLTYAGASGGIRVGQISPELIEKARLEAENTIIQSVLDAWDRLSENVTKLFNDLFSQAGRAKNDILAHVGDDYQVIQRSAVL